MFQKMIIVIPEPLGLVSYYLLIFVDTRALAIVRTHAHRNFFKT